MNFNLPKQITQGDRVSWVEELTGECAVANTFGCFIRGNSALNLIGVPDGMGNWVFEISETQTEALSEGVYHAQFVAYIPHRKTLGVAKFQVCPSFENLSEFDSRSSEEKELAELEIAIAKLSGGVAEYYIGDRRVRYQELPALYERQTYLRNRIAKMKDRSSIGGRNVGITFC